MKLVARHLGDVQHPLLFAGAVSDACLRFLRDQNGFEPKIDEVLAIWGDIARSARDLRRRLHRANELHLLGSVFEAHHLRSKPPRGLFPPRKPGEPVGIVGDILGHELEKALLRNDVSNALQRLECLGQVGNEIFARHYPRRSGPHQTLSSRYHAGDAKKRLVDRLADIWCETAQPLTGSVDSPFHHFIDACWSWAINTDPPSFDRAIKEAPKRRAHRLAKTVEQRGEATDPPEQGHIPER